MVKYKIIISIFIIYAFMAFSLLIIPAKSSVENLWFIIFINLIFLLLVIVFSVITYIIYPKKNIIYRKNKITSNIDRNLSFLIISPLVGFLLVLYDRTVLRGIDYSVGLRAARYQWLETTGGSIFGLTGNLLIPFSYIGIYFLIIYFEDLKKLQKYYLIISIIVGVLGHAALNGGRSNILLALIMVLIGFIFRKTNIKTKKQYIFTKNKIIFLLLIIVTFSYISYIIESSASMGGVELKTLVVLGIEGLYGEVDKSFYSEEYNFIHLIFIYMIAYLFHGQWTTQVTYSLINPEGTYTCPPLFYFFLEKYHLIEPSGVKYFSETGAFISLPGAFFYDYGFFGIIFLSTFLGMLLGVVFIIIDYSKYIGALKMVFIVSVLYIVFLSPILPVYGLSYFNFIIFSFILLSIIN